MTRGVDLGNWIGGEGWGISMLHYLRRRVMPEFASIGALRSAAFAAFWPAITIALTGTWMRALVQGYFVYERTHDPFLTALVQVFQGLPVLLLSPLAGIAADRFDRRWLLATIQVC